MSGSGGLPERSRGRWWFLLPLAATLIVVGWLVVLTFHASQSAVRHELGEAEGSTQAQWVLGLGVLTALVFWLPRRGQQRSLWLPTSTVGAMIVVALGIATYAPCVPSESKVYAPIGWVLSMFTGDFEFEGPGAVCATAFPPGFELARSMAISLTLAGALGVALVIARRQLDRWAAARSGDVDVVVGLDSTTLPLVEALLSERRDNRGRAPWIDTRPGWLGGMAQGATGATRAWWWWLTGLRPGDARRIFKLPPRVVVLETNPRNPLIDTVRREGGIVLITDARSLTTLRPVITRFRWGASRRIALRRLYAVTPDQRLNHAVRDAACAILEGRLERHLDDLVPRIFVRMDDAREARRWRLHQIQRLGIPHDSESRGGPAMLVSDSLTLDGLAAELVVDQVLSARGDSGEQRVPTHLVLVGDGQLALTVLDELAWQFWCRAELRWSRGEDPQPESQLRFVTLAGPKSGLRRAEWEDIRAPWSALGEGSDRSAVTFEVLSTDEDGELAAVKILSEDESAVVVFVDSGVEHEAAASRLARRFPGGRAREARVLVRADTGSTIAGSVIPGGLFQFAPTLVSFEGGRAVPPQDSVTRMARQQHSVYLEQSRRQADASASHEPDAPRSAIGTRLTGVSWQALPAFFREDNVRQHWLVLSWFTANGFRWDTVTNSSVHGGTTTTLAAATSVDVLTSVANAEYDRWRFLRETNGWWPCEDGARNDARRLHPDLRGWERVDISFNQQLIRDVLARMWATGLAPARVADDHPGSGIDDAQSPEGSPAESSIGS